VHPRPTILLVDDDASTAEQLVREVEREFRVLTATTTDEALALLAANDVGVLLVAQRVAGTPGTEIVARARTVAPDTPALLITRTVDPQALLTAMNSGLVYRYVRIPWDPGDLRATLKNALEVRTLRHERDALVDRLQRRLEALSILYEVTAASSELSTTADIVDQIMRTLHRIVRFDIAASLISVGAPQGTVMHLHCQSPVDEQTLTATRDHVEELFGTLTGRELDEVVVQVTGERLPSTRPQRVQSSTHIPIVVDGQTAGLIFLASLRPRAFTIDDEKLLYVLANQTAEAVRRLSLRIADERHKMGLMVESMADGVIMTDDGGEVFLINPSGRRMLGLPKGTQITRKYLKEKLGFYPFELVARSSVPGAAPQPVREELKIDDQVLHSIVSPVVDAAGKAVGTVVVLRDITERKELERRKEEFVSVVSHELRTPLTSITGALDIVLKEYAGGLGSKQRRYLELARDSCSKLNLIVDDLLDVARLERGKMAMSFQPLPLDALARECVDRYRANAEAKRVQLSFRADESVRIVGDPDRLTQVLHNLLSNAVKFTPEDGRIEIEVFGPGVAATHVGVSVWNNGDPIPESDRERVFDKFEQVQMSTTRRVGGTGLGLAISRAIIEGHGGRIWVENAPAGTKFVFTLPSAPADADGEREPAPRTGDTHPPPPTRETPPLDAAETPTGKLVLVVDDDRYSSYILKGALMAAGHKVHVVHDADEALTWARDKKPDLITVDVVMPGIDGLALLEILKHDPDTKKIPVAVVSGVAERERAVAAGADAFLRKPVDVDKLREITARLIAERGRGSQVRILVVDDDPAIRMICREVLEAAGYVVREAADGRHAVDEARHYRPDLVLLDVMMPDMDGFAAAKKLRSEPSGAMTPIIFVSARGQTADKVRAFKLGADDYLVKPFDAAELVARVEKALERRERELGASPTTKLPGSTAIEQEMERRLAEGGDVAFCYLDLDNLKAFNDYYGYAKADGVIRQTGDLVRDVIAREGGPSDFIGHIAGDDFVFITDAARADRVCRAICESFDRLVPLYYNKVDRERGYIETADRYGQVRKFPIMSVSIAALTMHAGERAPWRTYAELASAAAEAKQRAKAIPGSSYVRDAEVVFPETRRGAA
jgi:PAS domain S-box-containing protein